jgi:hypothetical protein
MPGGRYRGYLIEGVREGPGTFLWEEGKDAGTKYDGEFVNDKICGVGLLIHPDGEKYKGEWKDNMANGNGLYTYTDGSTYEGEFKDNCKHG